MFRKAMTNVTFSDGTYIPKGTLVMAASGYIQREEETYPEPYEFKPFRFVPEDPAAAGVSQNLATPRPDYLPFGLGKHAWYVSRYHMSSQHGAHARCFTALGVSSPHWR